MSRDRLVELLYDRSEGYWRPKDLSEYCGLDAPALREALERLEGEGFALERSPAQGVRLLRPVRPDSHLIMRNLDTERVGRDVICFDAVDSTNDVAFGASCPGGDGLVVVADFQRRGRGRLGRQWTSPPGANVLMSVLLCEGRPARADDRSHETLTIMVGLAVAEAIEEISPRASRQACVKWPNDILMDDAKVAGVLVEVRGAGEGRAMVAGIGINANAAPRGVGAGCLADYFARPVERIELIRALIRRMDAWCKRIAAGGAEVLHEPWKSRCRMINRRLRVRSADGEYVGRVLDVSPLEGLVLVCDDGRHLHLPARSTTVLSTNE